VDSDAWGQRPSAQRQSNANRSSSARKSICAWDISKYLDNWKLIEDKLESVLEKEAIALTQMT